MMTTENTRRSWLHLLLLAAVLPVAAITGCAKQPALVPAPVLYTSGMVDPYADVPEVLRSGSATVIYATDRMEEPTKDGSLVYGHRRSPTLVFGTCTVQMGESATWEELRTASVTEKRPKPIPLAVTSIDPYGTFPATTTMVRSGDAWEEDPVFLAEDAEAEKKLCALLDAQLANTPHKEVYLFIHGYNNAFESGAFRTSQIWHFVGRRGVGVSYSWPAKSGGALRGYTQDRESSEFTTIHLKRFIRALAACKSVQKIHMVAHSRGTGVLVTALRELNIHARGAGKRSRDMFKIGQVVLAAPDIDSEVFMQQFADERAGMLLSDQITLYVSRFDQAIGISGWLFRSVQRLGRLALRDFSADLVTKMDQHPVISIVDVKVRTDRRGHSYFLNNPMVLSDLILVLRDGRRPGAENGRPLVDRPGAFWELHKGYPLVKP